MAANYSDIKEWLYYGKDKGNSHMVMVCDTWDYTDSPTWVKEGDSVEECIRENSGNMCKVMEVYNYKMDLEEQLQEGRAYHIETPKVLRR